MKTMNAINEAATTLARKLKLPEGADTNTILTANIGHEWDDFQAKYAQGIPQEELQAAMGPTKNAISLYNDYVRNVRLDQLKAMGLDPALSEYMEEQTVIGYGIKKGKGKDAGYELDNAASVELVAYDVVEALYPVEKRGILDACCIFADNLAKLNYKGDEKAAVTRAGLSGEYVAMRKRMGWDIPSQKLSKGVLAAQLTEIVKMVLHGKEIRMINADVTYLINSIIQGKSTANKAGSFIMRDEKTVVNFIFRAAYTRLHGLPYEFQTATRGANAPLSVENNKDMAEAPIKSEKPVEVTEEYVEIPEQE